MPSTTYCCTDVNRKVLWVNFQHVEASLAGRDQRDTAFSVDIHPGRNGV